MSISNLFIPNNDTIYCDTLNANNIIGPSGVVTLNGVQTLTNKTLAAPIITNPTITGLGNITCNHLSAGDLILTNAPLITATISALTYEGTGEIRINTQLADVGSTQTLLNKTITNTGNTITIGGTNVTSLINQDVRFTSSPTFVGVSLATTGGTPSSLTYYETFATASTLTGIWAASQAITLTLTRVGNVVTMTGTSTTSASSIAAAIIIGYTLPARFRPSTIQYLPVTTNRGGFVVSGFVQVNSSGQMFIYNTSTVGAYTFIGAGSEGVNGFSITWNYNA